MYPDEMTPAEQAEVNQEIAILDNALAQMRDPQVGVIDNLGRQFCMPHIYYTRGTTRPVYAAHMRHETIDPNCDACHLPLLTIA